MNTCSRKVLSFNFPAPNTHNGSDSIDVYLPQRYTRKGDHKSFKDPAYFLVKEIAPEKIILEGEEGEIILEDLRDFYNTFTKHKTNWIGCNSLTQFLRWYEREEVARFGPPFNQPITREGFTLEGFPVLGRYRINNYYTINRVDHFTLDKFKIDSLDKVKLAAEKLLALDAEYLYLSPISPGSTASETMLQHVRPMEFNLIRNGDTEAIRLMYDSYYALRQDNAYIGSYPTLQIIDAKRAFLTGLMHQLSYAPRNNIGFWASKYIKKAHAGWTEIIVDIPAGMFNPPIPYRDPVTNIVTHPTGKFKTTVAKPYLDLLEDMKLPYKILKGYWLVPTSSNTKSPFLEFCVGLWNLLEAREEEFYPINIKAFYFTIIGHMMHIHEVIDPKTGEVYYETSRDFHPGIASMVSTEVDCDVYRLMATAENPFFFSADGGGAEKFLRVPSSFKTLTGSGLSFNPGLKDKPGKTPAKNLGLVRELIHKHRDEKNLKLLLPTLVSPYGAISKPWLWGTKQYYHTTIQPSCGHRWLENTPKRLGELEDRRFRSTPPFYQTYSIPEVGGYVASPQYKPLTINQLLEIMEVEL